MADLQTQLTEDADSSAPNGRKKRVVILGAGFGGLAAAKALSDADVEVVVVDQRNHHTFQPLLYQVASAGLGVDDICYSSRGIFATQANARALQGRLVDIAFDTKTLHLQDGSTLSYDYLVLALGAVTADFGVPGVAEHGFGLKSAHEAVKLRSHILSNFEQAERCTPDQQTQKTTIVIAGGGPTGVEMAGGFSELIDRVLKKDFPGVDTDRTNVILVEGADRLLSTFAPKLGVKAKKKLEKMGVEVLTSTQVTSVDVDAVHLSTGQTIPTSTVVWAAGVKAHPLMAAVGLPAGRGGRVVVDDTLRVEGHDDVFVIGDLAAATNADGSLVPQVAPAAIQGGKFVAAQIADMVTHDPSWSLRDTKPFRYRDKGSMATIGRNAAVVEPPRGPAVTGFIGWLAWLALHLVMLIGFRNRMRVLVSWAHNYLTYGRESRLIVEPDPDPTTLQRKADESDVSKPAGQRPLVDAAPAR